MIKLAMEEMSQVLFQVDLPTISTASWQYSIIVLASVGLAIIVIGLVWGLFSRILKSLFRW
jgi:predicted aspartyl protease